MPSEHPSLDTFAAALRASSRSFFVLDQGAAGTRLSWSPATSAPPIGPGAAFWCKARAMLAELPPGGGLVGWIGYEAGRWCEKMPAPRGPRPLPDVHLQPVHGFVELGAGGVTVAGSPRFQAEAAQLAQGEALDGPVRPVPPPVAPPPVSSGPAPAAWYPAAVSRLLDHIFAGDCYQANLAWRQDLAPPPDPLGAWLALRQSNPAAWGAYLSTPLGTVLSNSPELYLRAAGGQLESRPIKGTARRSEGAAGRSRLQHSEKETAELTMIVYLVRNDLGRVAATGSVRAGPRALRACGYLWHAEQAVTATLAPGHDVWDALRASFPPGSITGAPKVRAMELIHALEPVPRGVYTGAIGWFDTAGDAALSVAIRTATLAPAGTSFHLGAGIVADSDPAAEWDETLAKGVRLAAGLAPRTGAPR